MACLRSIEILHEIYTLFKYASSALLDEPNGKQKNPVKLPMCINADGTVTITLPSSNGQKIYARFNGSGTVELWSSSKGTDIFWIEEPECTPEQISNRFIELLRDHGFEFSGNFTFEDSINSPTIFDHVRMIGIPSKKYETI